MIDSDINVQLLFFMKNNPKYASYRLSSSSLFDCYWQDICAHLCRYKNAAQMLCVYWKFIKDESDYVSNNKVGNTNNKQLVLSNKMNIVYALKVDITYQ